MTAEKHESADSGSLDRASEVFFAVRELDPAAQDEAITRMCGGDRDLESLVRLLLRGDKAPLPVESLAENIRAAQATRSIGSGTGGQGSIGTTPSIIGHYKIMERLGEGGFGIVYLAEQERPVRRRVALKIIKLGMDTKQVVARFEAERQALAMMDHPSIAKVFDAGATETGRPYFVMELVRGLPITEYCDLKKLSIRERLDLLAQVCDALQHAHQKGVIHRDIKPSNVLVTEAADRAAPKIIDFGVAKATTMRLTEKTVYTEFRQMIGTPEYMSPEQAGQAADDVDTRTDVYAAGVLLYELLTGSTPFDSRRLRSAAYGEIQRIIREEDPPRPSTKIATTRATLASVAQQRSIPPVKLTSTIQGELDWIVMKAMEKDRTRRYDSAGSLGRDIRRYLAGEAVQAAPPGRAYLARKFVVRHRGAVISAGLVVGVLVAGLVGTTVGFFNAETQRAVAVSEKTRADAKAEEARAAESASSRHAYSASMLSAWQAIALNQPGVVRMYLDAAPERLRGWEWRVLNSRLDTSVRSLPCPMPGWRAGEDAMAYRMVSHPDGRSFFTIRGFEIDAAQRWDSSTGQLLARYSRPADKPPDILSASRAIVSSDGSRLALYCGLPATQKPCAMGVWDLNTNSPLLRSDVSGIPAGDGLRGVSPDGSRAVRCSLDLHTISLQDVRAGATLATNNDASTVDGTFDSTGKLFACEDEHGTIRLLDGTTLAPIAVLRGHKNIIHGFAFSLDGRVLATASIDNTARVWDLSNDAHNSVVLEHPCAVEAVSLSSDASIAATIGSDRAIRVWNSRTGELLGLYSNERLVPGAVMVMPDGRTVAGREQDGTVRFWDITAESTVNLRGHHGYINSAQLAEGPGIIVSAGWDGWRGEPGCVRLWDDRTGDQIAAFGEPGDVAYTLAVSPRGRYAAVGITRASCAWTPADEQGDSRLVLVDLQNAHVVVHHLERLNLRTNRIFGLAFDPTGDMVAVGRLGALEIRRASDGELVHVRTEGLDGAFIQSPAWSPDGRAIACFPTQNNGQEIGAKEPCLLLRADTLATEHTFQTGSPFCLEFSRDSSRVFAAGRDGGMVRSFDARTGAALGTFKTHDGLVNGLAFSPDGSRLATVAGDEGDIIVWDTTTQPPYERVARFHEAGFVSSAVWDSTGKLLIGACDRTIRLWDDTPLRERVRAREDRKEALSQVEPLVSRLFDDLHDPARVVERVNADATLSPLHRRVAMQLVLKRSLEEPPP